MAYKFPSSEWLQALEEKINTDQQYAHIARNWEGDLLFVIEKDETLQKETRFYLDLWHGKCRKALILSHDQDLEEKPTFTLSAPRKNFVRVLVGELDPLQAMLTRKLKVKGNMSYMMRNMPVVLDFVRCAKEVPTKGLP
jgi:putative sterol carrier protein